MTVILGRSFDKILTVLAMDFQFRQMKTLETFGRRRGWVRDRPQQVNFASPDFCSNG